MGFSRPEYWVGGHYLFQGIFSTQGSNPGLPHRRQILYQLSHKGSPRILGCSLSLLQRIFPTQGSNPGLLHCGHIYQLSLEGSPRILEWVAYLFSSGYSGPRNQTGVSSMAGRVFTKRTIRETLIIVKISL